MATSATDQKTAITQTTNATPTNLLSYVQPNSSGAVIQVSLIAYDGSGNVKGWLLEAVTKRVADSLSVIGSVQNLMTAQGDVGLATASATIVISGANVIVEVTGIAATTINWRVRVTIDLYTP